MNTFNGHQVAKIFDPVQTHVIHGVRSSEIDSLKAELKRVGAVRFRSVKNRYLEDTVSLCFKLK
ncbi:hypothetical protein [Vibrio phage phiKT1024]|nr:hypothetical protein [Vibrio phage phiKT1024]